MEWASALEQHQQAIEAWPKETQALARSFEALRAAYTQSVEQTLDRARGFASALEAQLQIARDEAAQAELSAPHGRPDTSKTEAIERLVAALEELEGLEEVLRAPQEVWVVDPSDQTVTIHRAGQPALILGSNEVLAGDPLLTGLELAVRDVFA